ncbi:CopY/TcrY family copper transport repressor [Natronobacillus azotifigens]|uniref:CopY/TcrY family copper transport repressor n=1 Tax=Natronobacillus azotifigens TaxID=472978 RepID=A0A9J6RAT0_9BACI|nr:CopY/TcrY family copper transport repressor [Natronobacillus azotifigens]MCZ0702647.1 CopY/TcrY family copper transport repressor [Natronobacillus azotifigens]
MVTEDKPKITDSEWEVMRVVWTLRQATSKDICEVLQVKKDWKQSTTKTFIGRLVKKGMLNTRSEGKRFLYTAVVNEDESLKAAKESFLDNVCNKQVGKTITKMIAEATLTHEDIRLLEDMIAEKKKEAVDDITCNCVPGQCKCKMHC